MLSQTAVRMQRTKFNRESERKPMISIFWLLTPNIDRNECIERFLIRQVMSLVIQPPFGTVVLVTLVTVIINTTTVAVTIIIIITIIVIVIFVFFIKYEQRLKFDFKKYQQLKSKRFRHRIHPKGNESCSRQAYIVAQVIPAGNMLAM